MTDANADWFAAVEGGDLATIDAALAAGADVNAKNRIESTALHIAVMSRNLDLIRWLCEHGADPSLRDSDGLTAFGYCGGADDPEVQVLTETWTAKFGPKAKLTRRLFEALTAADTHAIQQLLAEGVDLNDRGWNHDTPLIHATNHCSLDVLRLLLDAGADASVATFNGHTPLHAACRRGPKQGEQKALLLIERGADVNARNAMDATPLHLAAESGYLLAITALIDRGADPNAASSLDDTPLRLAGKKKQVIELLKSRGAR